MASPAVTSYAQLQKKIIETQDPFAILTLTLEHASELDVVTAVTALDAISKSPRRKEVERDMRLQKLVFDINYMLHSGHRQFRSRELARCSTAYAKLGIKHPAMMYCIGKELEKKVYEFKASEIVSCLLAFGLAGIQDVKMQTAAVDEITRRVGQCSPKEVGEVAWALGILRFRSDAAMAAISDAVDSMMRDFGPISLVQVLWALDSFGHRALGQVLQRGVMDSFPDAPNKPDWTELVAAICCCGEAPPDWVAGFNSTTLPTVLGTLTSIAEGEAVSARDLRKLPGAAPHLGKTHTQRALAALGVQATSGRGGPRWVEAARAEIGPIYDDDKWPVDIIPMTDKDERVSLPIVDKDTYARNMADFGVDNFGKIGGRCLMNQIGIGKANENWVQNAKQFVTAWGDGVGKKSDDWKANTVHRRIYVFAEYHFSSTLRPMAPLLEGTSFQLNGLRSDPETARRPWLCAVPLPISKWVDRTLCAEFQLLSEVCEMINRTGIELNSPELRHSVYGLLSLYLSEPSCVSCVGSMKQFQTLFPAVDILVDCSSVVEPLMARTEIDLEARQREEEEQKQKEEEAAWKEAEESGAVQAGGGDAAEAAD